MCLASRENHLIRANLLVLLHGDGPWPTTLPQATFLLLPNLSTDQPQSPLQTNFLLYSMWFGFSLNTPFVVKTSGVSMETGGKQVQSVWSSKSWGGGLWIRAPHCAALGFKCVLTAQQQSEIPPACPGCHCSRWCERIVAFPRNNKPSGSRKHKVDRDPSQVMENPRNYNPLSPLSVRRSYEPSVCVVDFLNFASVVSQVFFRGEYCYHGNGSHLNAKH